MVIIWCAMNFILASIVFSIVGWCMGIIAPNEGTINEPQSRLQQTHHRSPTGGNHPCNHAHHTGTTRRDDDPAKAWTDIRNSTGGLRYTKHDRDPSFSNSATGNHSSNHTSHSCHTHTPIFVSYSYVKRLRV